MTARQPEWAEYIDTFHTQHPGITEDVLARCTDEHGAGPYAWLTERLDRQAQVVDLACGSGPTRACIDGDWVGVDRSLSELRRGRERGRATFVQGDVTRLPIRDDTASAVVCSMALMLIDPCSAALDEIRRILAPGGELRVLLPTTRPLTIADRWEYLKLYGLVRVRPQFPATPLRRSAAHAFAASGLIIVSDESHRFDYPIGEPADVDRFVASWYRPHGGRDEVRPWRRRGGALASIGVPLRRIIARTTLAT